MTWDYTVPDYYFDANLMLDRKMQEQLKETYMLPTRTFWRPEYFDDYREPNLVAPNYAIKMRDHRDVPPEVVKILMDPKDPEAKNWKPFSGVLISYLRPFEAKEKSDFIKLDKFFCASEKEEQNKVNELKSKIENKLSKVEAEETFSHRFKDPYM